MGTPDFCPAHPEDYPIIRVLLIEEGLPSKDTAIGQVGRFHLAVQDGELLACAGLELYGSDALFRSVVVARCAHQNGLDHAPVGVAECDVLTISVNRLSLLVTTATDYFIALGHERFDRCLTPGSLQSNSQPGLLCPMSVTYMTKNLL